MQILSNIDIKDHCTGEIYKSIIDVLTVDLDGLKTVFGTFILSQRANIDTYSFSTVYGKIKLFVDNNKNRNFFEIYPYLSKDFNKMKNIIIDKIKSVWYCWLSLKTLFKNKNAPFGASYLF